MLGGTRARRTSSLFFLSRRTVRASNIENAKHSDLIVDTFFPGPVLFSLPMFRSRVVHQNVFWCHLAGLWLHICICFLCVFETLCHTVICHNTIEVLVECVFSRSTHTVSEQEQMDNMDGGVCEVVNNVCNAWIVEPLSIVTFYIFLPLSDTVEVDGPSEPFGREVTVCCLQTAQHVYILYVMQYN